MYCARCGAGLQGHFKFCSHCGASATDARKTEAGATRLSRAREGKKIAGVCAGVARYLDMDVTLVRLVWVLITILPPLPGILAYIICWVVMPMEPLPAATPVAESPSNSGAGQPTG
jgi:phage shock protein C